MHHGTAVKPIPSIAVTAHAGVHVTPALRHMLTTLPCTSNVTNYSKAIDECTEDR